MKSPSRRAPLRTLIARASSFIGLGDRSKRVTPVSSPRRVHASKARGSAARHRKATTPSAPPIPAWHLWRIVTIVLAAFAVAGALQAGPSSTTPQIATTTAGLTDSLKSFFTRLWSPAASDAEQQGTAYLYDEQGNLISETGTGGANSAGSTQYIYLPTANGPMPIAAVINGQIYAVHSDHLNTPRRLTDSQDQAVWQWAYSAFGDEKPTIAKNRFANLEVNPNPGTTNFPDITYNVRYPNHYADEESGLFENRDRFYSPSLGRYTQGDAFGLSAGTNRFVYALDDPLSVFDDDGMAPKKPNGAAPAPYSPLTGGTIKPSPVPGWQPLQIGVPGRARLGGAGSIGAGRGVVGPFCSPTGVDATKGLGDLTRAEARQIQSVVNEAGRPLEVVGSAAAGTRRGVGSDLPLGKGPGTRSDIDYVVPPSSLQHFEGLQGKLPSIDPKTGIIPGVGNPNIGPAIRFEPK